MRIHGGYGYSKEFVVERLYRDAPLMLIGEGTNDILRTVIATIPDLRQGVHRMTAARFDEGGLVSVELTVRTWRGRGAR